MSATQVCGKGFLINLFLNTELCYLIEMEKNLGPVDLENVKRSLGPKQFVANGTDNESKRPHAG